MQPSSGVSFRHAWKTENIQTVSAQPYLRCLSRAISLPHSNRQSCNMNMQFYDHSGETHVRTRTSYAFRPRRTSLGLFGRKVTEILGAGAQSVLVRICCVHYVVSSTPYGKFRNSFLGECRSEAFVHSPLNTNLMYIHRFRSQTSEFRYLKGRKGI